MSQSAPAGTPSPFEQSLNISAWGQLPQIVVDSRYGFTIGNPARFGRGFYPDEHLYMAQEQLSWVHGNLLVKTGLEFSHNTDATSRLRNQTGTYYYSSVENFASDALAFSAYGIGGQLNPMDQHNCDQTGRPWRDSSGVLHGLGYLPCYSYYSQTIGPADWWLSTNDWAGISLRNGNQAGEPSLHWPCAGSCNSFRRRSQLCRIPICPSLDTCPVSAISGVPASVLPGAQPRAAGRWFASATACTSAGRGILSSRRLSRRPDPSRAISTSSCARQTISMPEALRRFPMCWRRAGKHRQARRRGVCAKLPQWRDSSGRS